MVIREDKFGMKKILVIGASGFVGRHIVQALLADGYPVRCLSRNPDLLKDVAATGCEIGKHVNPSRALRVASTSATLAPAMISIQVIKLIETWE